MINYSSFFSLGKVLIFGFINISLEPQIIYLSILLILDYIIAFANSTI